mmetsp:Transcript_60415/g.125286  ORF Transcript_60415/g.125286 Transcript_60415/m.125286 type:complete len:222 (+) Transcript_60415:74-739(+)
MHSFSDKLQKGFREKATACSARGCLLRTTITWGPRLSVWAPCTLAADSGCSWRISWSVRTTWWPSGAGRPMSQGDGRISPRWPRSWRSRSRGGLRILEVLDPCPECFTPAEQTMPSAAVFTRASGASAEKPKTLVSWSSHARARWLNRRAQASSSSWPLQLPVMWRASAPRKSVNPSRQPGQKSTSTSAMPSARKRPTSSCAPALNSGRRTKRISRSWNNS